MTQRASFATVFPALLLLLQLLLPTATVAFSSPSSLSSIRTAATTTARSAVASASAPVTEGGLAKTVVRVGTPGEAPIGRGDVVTVKYTCYSTNAERDGNGNGVLLARSESQKMVVGDGSMVPGWDAALRTMVVGERSVVRVVDPSLGFDARASSALKALGMDDDDGDGDEADRRPQLEFDIEVLKVQTASRAAELFDLSFDAMALEDNTPKTAQEIAEAYQVKMANKAPEKEGLEGWIETIRNYYFFGFFEGETGEEAPWYLRPSITFPLAFAVVGSAFYVSLLSGAISEKGAQSIDELDEVKILAPALVSMVTSPASAFPSPGGGL